MTDPEESIRIGPGKCSTCGADIDVDACIYGHPVTPPVPPAEPGEREGEAEPAGYLVEERRAPSKEGPWSDWSSDVPANRLFPRAQLTPKPWPENQRGPRLMSCGSDGTESWAEYRFIPLYRSRPAAKGNDNRKCPTCFCSAPDGADRCLDCMGCKIWSDGCETCHPAVAVDEREAHFRSLYFDLLMCVGNVYEGETRHATAKRYLLAAENQNNPPADARKGTP